MGKRSLLAASAILVFVALGCGGGDGGGPGGGGSGFTAVIDGKAWEATPISISALANAGVPGTVSLIGSQNVSTGSLSLTMSIYNVGGVGKYPLGVGINTIGGIGQLGESTGMGGNANSWITAGTGSDGMVEITSLSNGRIVGTFNYTVEPGRNNAVGGNRVVTDGKFNLALMGTVTPLAEEVGSQLSAEMNGVHYNAATINGSLMDFMGGAGVNISTISSLHGLSIMLVGVTAPGTYTYSNMAPQRLVTAGRTGGTADTCCWGVNAPGDIAEIVVTSLTAKRVKGTFSGTLKPQPNKPATQDLVITNGTFDVGIPLTGP